MARISPAAHPETDVVDDDLTLGVEHGEVRDDEGVAARIAPAPCRPSSSTARPTIIDASSVLEAVGDASPTTLPRRMTVIRSATSRTSRSLWVMKTIDVPDSLSWRMIDHELVGLLRGEHRGRLVEDEHLGVAGEGLDDLDPLLHADRQIADQGIRVDVEAEAGRDLAHDARAAARSSRAAEPVCS